MTDGRWVNSNVVYTLRKSSVHSAMSINKAYLLFSSLNEHPRWSPWLKHVDYNAETGLSNWTISLLGLTYSWKAKNTIMDPPHLRSWESLDGLPNRGRVEFIPDADALRLITVNMTLSYDLPDAAAFVLRKLGPWATKLIDNTILGDLERFDAVLETELNAPNSFFSTNSHHTQVNTDSTIKATNILETKESKKEWRVAIEQNV